jgi:hypothetical protein
MQHKSPPSIRRSRPSLNDDTSLGRGTASAPLQARLNALTGPSTSPSPALCPSTRSAPAPLLARHTAPSWCLAERLARQPLPPRPCRLRAEFFAVIARIYALGVPSHTRESQAFARILRTVTKHTSQSPARNGPANSRLESTQNQPIVASKEERRSTRRWTPRGFLAGAPVHLAKV